MPKIKKTPENPYGLSPKQRLVIEDMVERVKKGGQLEPVKSTKKFYSVKNDNTASSVTSQNFSNENFRNGLLAKLTEKNILGKDGKVGQRLMEGLDATTKRMQMIDRDENGKPIYEYIKEPDHNIRLKFIQEIHKIAGVYAPEKKDIRTFSMYTDMTEEELNKKISQLQEEIEK